MAAMHARGADPPGWIHPIPRNRRYAPKPRRPAILDSIAGQPNTGSLVSLYILEAEQLAGGIWSAVVTHLLDYSWGQVYE